MRLPKELWLPTDAVELLQELKTSDDALQLALQYPLGSNQRRSLIAAALTLERRLRPRGRPKGTARPQYLDRSALILMYRIALDTGERAAERLARLAFDTLLFVEKNRLKSDTYKPSTVRRLARRWQQALTPAARKELDELTAERGGVQDPETVVRQLGDDPDWQRRAQSYTEK